MPAPMQRFDDQWEFNEQREKVREALRVQSCEEFRQQHVAKTQLQKKHLMQRRAEERTKWSELQMERRSAEMNERLEALRVRSRALKEATRERKIKAQIEERDRQKADEHAAKLTELIQGRAGRVERQMARHAAKVQKHEEERRQILDVFKIRVAAQQAHAEELERRERDAAADERRAAFRDNAARATRDEAQASRSVQIASKDHAQMERNLERVNYAKQRERAEEGRQNNIRILGIDTRVPLWIAPGWHKKEDKTEWRWPFSLDWSWLDRGERVLKDERFAGLKLPEDFVRPSERIMSSRGVTPRSARSDRETSATPRSARGSDLVSSVTPRSSRKSTPRTPRSGLQDQDVGRAVNFTIVGKNVWKDQWEQREQEERTTYIDHTVGMLKPLVDDLDAAIEEADAAKAADEEAVRRENEGSFLNVLGFGTPAGRDGNLQHRLDVGNFMDHNSEKDLAPGCDMATEEKHAETVSLVDEAPIESEEATLTKKEREERRFALQEARDTALGAVADLADVLRHQLNRRVHDEAPDGGTLASARLFLSELDEKIEALHEQARIEAVARVEAERIATEERAAAEAEARRLAAEEAEAARLAAIEAAKSPEQRAADAKAREEAEAKERAEAEAKAAVERKIRAEAKAKTRALTDEGSASLKTKSWTAKGEDGRSSPPTAGRSGRSSPTSRDGSFSRRSRRRGNEFESHHVVQIA